MSEHRSLWQLLEDVGREHDRQLSEYDRRLSALLTVTRDLKLHIQRNTSAGGETLGNAELLNQLMLSDVSIAPPSPHRLPHTAMTSKPALVGLPPVTDSISSADVGSEAPAAGAAIPKGTSDDAAEASLSFNPPAANQELPSETTAVSKPLELSPRAAPIAQKHPDKPPDDPFDKAWTLHTMQSSAPREAMDGVPGWLNQNLWFVTTSWFVGLVATLIVFNTIIMMVDAQYSGLYAGYISGFPGVDSPMHSWPRAQRLFGIADTMFTFIFFIELMLQILRFRLSFFKDPLNWIDILAVLGGLAQLLMEDGSSSTVVRLLRVSKPLRSARLLKNKHIQTSCNILVKCLKASVVTLFWSLCLLMMIQCIIGLLIGQIAQDFVSDLNNPENGRHEVFRYYGTMSRCIITMFEIHMANWASPCRVMINNVGEFWGNALVLYRCVVGFALMSVLGATFVQQAMSVQQHDQDLMILRKQKDTDRFNKKLKALFETMDTDGNGHLSRGEFNAITEDKGLKHWMESLDINPDDLQGLFDMLDTGDGFVSADEFLMGATRLRGSARSLDVAQLLVSVARLEHIIEKKAEHTGGLFQRFDTLEELIREKGKCSESSLESFWRKRKWLIHDE